MTMKAHLFGIYCFSSMDSGSLNFLFDRFVIVCIIYFKLRFAVMLNKVKLIYCNLILKNDELKISLNLISECSWSKS